jgi:hypothetical protein
MNHLKQSAEKILSFGIVMGALVGCATPKTLILATPAVSNTNTSFDPAMKFTDGGEVKSQYCRGDDATTAGGDSNIGLMDEVISIAQKQSSAKYIANAQFFAQGSCVLLEGNAMK